MAVTIRMLPTQRGNFSSARVGKTLAIELKAGASHGYSAREAQNIVRIMRETGFGHAGGVGAEERKLLAFLAGPGSDDRSLSRMVVNGEEIRANVRSGGERVFKQALHEELSRKLPWKPAGTDNFRIPRFRDDAIVTWEDAMFEDFESIPRLAPSELTGEAASYLASLKNDVGAVLLQMSVNGRATVAISHDTPKPARGEPEHFLGELVIFDAVEGKEIAHGRHADSPHYYWE